MSDNKDEKPIAKEEPTGPNWTISSMKAFAGIIKEIGLPGFIVLILVFIFMVWGTSEQKVEFIDRYILLKNIDEEPWPATLAIAFMALLVIIGWVYYDMRLRSAKEENKRIAREKSELQKLLIGKELQSSAPDEKKKQRSKKKKS